MREPAGVSGSKWAVLALVAAALLIPCMMLVVATGFDGLYGQDAYGYVNYARDSLLDALRNGRLPPPFFFPVGYPLTIAMGALAGLDPDLVAQAVSLVAGATVPVLVALLAYALVPVTDERQRFWTAIGAGLVAALTGQLWQSSVVAMSDTLALACATAGMVAAVRYSRAPTLLWAAAALALLTFAIETRLIYAAAGAAAVAPLAYGLMRRPRRRAALDAAVAIAVALVVAAPMTLPILDAITSGQPAPFLGQAQVHGWDPFNALRSSFATADGWLTYSMPTGVFYLLQPVAPYWFATLAVLAVPGLWAVIRDRDVVRAAVLLAWPVLTIGFMAGGAYQNTRFYLAALPPVAILVGSGAWLVWTAAARRWPRFGGRVIVGVVIVALVVNALLAWRFTDNFIERVGTEKDRVASLAAELPASARVISLGPTGQLVHDGYDAIELTSIDPERVADAVAAERPTYLLVDMASIQSQWAGSQPQRAVEAIDRQFGLSESASSGSWTLYRIERPISFDVR